MPCIPTSRMHLGLERSPNAGMKIRFSATFVPSSIRFALPYNKMQREGETRTARRVAQQWHKTVFHAFSYSEFVGKMGSASLSERALPNQQTSRQPQTIFPRSIIVSPQVIWGISSKEGDLKAGLKLKANKLEAM